MMFSILKDKDPHERQQSESLEEKCVGMRKSTKDAHHQFINQSIN